MNSYQQALQERKEKHLLRHLPLPPSEGIDFYSNDYLGLARSQKLKEEIRIATQKISTNGATGSRLLSGNSNYSEDVENKVATFHNAEAALVYPSGYTANLGLISCLATSNTILFMDELLHASLIDGARLGKSKRIRFKHNDVHHLETRLNEVIGQKLVIVESIYSMDGDICPLEPLVEVCEKHDAMLIVDEAHSIGVLGSSGAGLVQQLGLEQRVTARVMTYGKAPGIHGAAIVGPKWLKEYQINFSRPLIFSTAPSPHQFACISAMYDVLPRLGEKRDLLQENVGYFMDRRNNHSEEWLESLTHIQSLIVPGNEQVIEMSERLKQKGINALPIRRPSVPEGKERIRFCLHAFNRREDIDLLFDVL